MVPITDNKAAWQIACKARPLEVGPGPVPSPAENEVVIKVNYAAVNSCDWNFQANPYWDLDYPFIFGTDVAGTIVQLGNAVTRFHLGQRVIGNCDNLITKKPTNGGFQNYSTCAEIFVAQIPDSLSLLNASVLPLSISTAASALYTYLSLPLPTVSPTPTTKILLIWGGSTSMGASAIQLGIASGYTIATICSASNFPLVHSLGARYCFDQKSPTVTEEVMKFMKNGDKVLDCIGSEETQRVCGEVVGAIGGGVLAVLKPPMGVFPEGVEAKFVLAMDIGFKNVEVGDAVWRKYIPDALAAGKFHAKPDPLLVRGGLEKVQEGMDILRRGVSARKVVVEICEEL